MYVYYKMSFHSEVVDNTNFLENYQELKKSNNTENILYTNEKTVVLGIRATQLSMNAVPLIEVPKGNISVTEIAELELKERKIPFIILRKLETHNEYWKLEDLI